jgi:exonuclease VII large subunit
MSSGSVAEQMPVILDILSKKLGVTRGELRQMATDGKLNSDVLLMLSGDFSELDDQATKLPRTVAQASDALMNNLGVAADALNDKLGLSQVAKSIDGVSQALDYWTKRLNGTTTEVDELGRQLSIQNGTLQRQQAVYDDLSDKTGMYGKYLQDQINKQKQRFQKLRIRLTQCNTLPVWHNNLPGICVPLQHRLNNPC